MEPIAFFNHLVSDLKTNSSATYNGDVIAIGHSDKHVGNFFVCDEVTTVGSHAVCAARVDAEKVARVGRGRSVGCAAD